jgi:hypothetical protein
VNWGARLNEQEVADKQAIRDLQNYYSYSIDAGDYDNLDDVFTVDVVADYGVAGFHEGVDAVKTTCRGALEPLTAVQHINGNHVAQINGDEATASCYFHVHQHREGTQGGDHFEMGGRYDDELERRPEGWRINKRKITIIWSDGNPEVRWP